MIGVTLIIFWIIILIGLFFILRDLNLWYWKVDVRIELQEETNNLLKKLINEKINNTSSLKETSLNNPDVMDKLIENLKN
jgi:hypothetical protein